MNLIYSLYNSFSINGEKHSFCINDSFFTYNQLFRAINKIRFLIKAHTGLNEKHFGLVTNNDLETYATIFALWLEGRAYVPINPMAPYSRNVEILESIKVMFVFDSLGKANFSSFKTLNVNNAETDVLNADIINISYNENNIAYVLFTSGSTGKPKGIPISFKNLNALFTELDLDNEYKLNASDRCLQMYDLTFDASLTALIPALLAGACVYTVPTDAIKYLSVFKLLAKYKLTVLKMVPSIIYYLRPYFNEIKEQSVRYSVFGGEKLYEDVIKEWAKCVPKAKILNHYGPTEFTVCSHYYTYKRNKINKSLNGVLAIGKPFKNINCLILDEKGNEVKNNNEGELCLSGKQLTSGYLNNKELNKTSFFNFKTASGEVKKFYKTGDLCVKDNQGYYAYVGRKDFQVKIDGYRVELGEVEYHVRNHEDMNSKNSLVVGVKTSSNKNELVLVIESTAFNTKAIIAHLNNKLSDYMIPKRIFFIENLPHNKNGKVDRNALRVLIQNKK